MTATSQADGLVVLTDPQSSGPYLARAFQEYGIRTVHVYDEFLREAMLGDDVASLKLLHTDLKQTLGELRRLRPVAVLAGGENGIFLADELASQLDLPHNLPKLSRARRDKVLMLRAVREAGLAVPEHHLVHDKDSLVEALSALDRFPVIVKPTGSAGGDQVHLCHDATAAWKAFHAIDRRTNVLGGTNRGAIVAEYLDGTQFQVSTVSIGGRHLVTEYYQQRVDMLGHRSLSRYLKTKPLRAQDYNAIAYALSCLDAMGVREGPANVELRVTARGPLLVEVNSRLMGPVMDPDPYYRAFGYAPQNLVAERYLDPARFRRRLDQPFDQHQLLARCYLRPPQAGTLARLRNIDVLRTVQGFYGVYRLPKPGSHMPDPHLTIATSCTAYLVDHDEYVLNASLDKICQMDSAGAFMEMEP